MNVDSHSFSPRGEGQDEGDFTANKEEPPHLNPLPLGEEDECLFTAGFHLYSVVLGNSAIQNLGA